MAVGGENEGMAPNDVMDDKASDWQKWARRGEWSPTVGSWVHGQHRGDLPPVVFFLGGDKRKGNESEVVREKESEKPGNKVKSRRLLVGGRGSMRW